MKKLKVEESNRDKKRARTITKYIEKEKWKKLRKYLEDENIDPGFRFYKTLTDFPLEMRKLFSNNIGPHKMSSHIKSPALWLLAKQRKNSFQSTMR